MRRKARVSTRPKRAWRGDLSLWANSRETGRETVCGRRAGALHARESVGRAFGCSTAGCSTARRLEEVYPSRASIRSSCSAAIGSKAENLPRTPAAGVPGPAMRESRSADADIRRTTRARAAVPLTFRASDASTSVPVSCKSLPGKGLSSVMHAWQENLSPPQKKGDILLFLEERNICRFFGFCTTYRSRETSIGRVQPHLGLRIGDCGLRIERRCPGWWR
jgi:hypothetical protein